MDIQSPRTPNAAVRSQAHSGDEVRAWIPDEHGDVLLVHDGTRMNLPGGPAHVAEADPVALTINVLQQTGLRVVPIRLLAMDRVPRLLGRPSQRHLIFLCARLSPEIVAGADHPRPAQWLHMWVGKQTAQKEMAPRHYRQFVSLWAAWQDQCVTVLTNGRPAFQHGPSGAIRESSHAKSANTLQSTGSMPHQPTASTTHRGDAP